MRTAAILNLKGGVGKTVTVVNTAAILARDHHQRVLVIDADSQCNTTEFFGGIPGAGSGTLADILRYGEEDIVDFALAAIQDTNFGGVDLIAGADSLMDLDLTKVETRGVTATCLRDLLAHLESLDAYDWVLVDCPPAFNAASAAALLAVDEVVIPIKLDAFSLRGMTNLLQQVRNMQMINPRLQVAGLLPTMWYKSEEIVDAEDTLMSSALHVFPHIRRSDRVDEMTFAQEPLLVTSPKSAAGRDYRRFVRELIEGGVAAC